MTKDKKEKRVEERKESIEDINLEYYEFPTGRQCPSPVNYEQLVSKNKQSIQCDGSRDMLQFPSDDICNSDVERRIRTIKHSYTDSLDASSLIVRESIKNYREAHRVVHFKYSSYGDSYLKLPRRGTNDGEISKEVFECDIEEKRRIHVNGDTESIAELKRGWLFVREETGIFTKPGKRRYVILKRYADGSHVLLFHKDPKCIESQKLQINLDSSFTVNYNDKRTFCIKSEKDKSHLLSADNDLETSDWLSQLERIRDKRNRSPTMSCKSSSSSSSFSSNFDSVDSNYSPELQNYIKETDTSLAIKRKENRRALFSLVDMADKEATKIPEGVMFNEQFGKRFVVKFHDVKIRLQATLVDNQKINPEPYFLSFALYDVNKKMKISEDFHVELNDENQSKLIEIEDLSNEPPIVRHDRVNVKAFKKGKTAIFSLSEPRPNIVLIGRIDKILTSEGVSGGWAPYIITPSEKEGNKRYEIVKQSAARLSKYRQPLAFTFRSLFMPGTTKLDPNAFFYSYVYKSETKISDEDLLDLLNETKQPPVSPFLCDFTVTVEEFERMPPNTLTRSLLPIRDNYSAEQSPNSESSLEIHEFIPNESVHTSPFTVYVNQLFVYPKALKYESQKMYSRARNILCTMELIEYQPKEKRWKTLRAIYAKPYEKEILSTTARTSVIHHNANPEWYDEFKIELPTQLKQDHYILFAFKHVNCKPPPPSKTKKDKQDIENNVGYALLPLFTDGKVATGDIRLPVMANWNPQLSPSSLHKSSNDIRYVDNQGKELFKVKVVLASTVYADCDHITKFFESCEKYKNTSQDEKDIINKIKVEEEKHNIPTRGSRLIPSAHKLHRPKQVAPKCDDRIVVDSIKALPGAKYPDIINFFTIICNQLFSLLRSNPSQSIASNIVKTLTLIVVRFHKDEKIKYSPFIRSVEYQYDFQVQAENKQNTIHEPLAKFLSELLENEDVALSFHLDAFMSHCNFFFDILIKSMAHFLIYSNRIKMSRTERFQLKGPYNFDECIQNLLLHLTEHIIKCVQRNDPIKRNSAFSANSHMAHFVKRCFSLIDRGLVFQLVKRYIDTLHSKSLSAHEAKIINEFKLNFLEIICSHEHFVALNLPMMQRFVRDHADVTAEDLHNDYSLSESFCKNHFLVGLLLQEVRSSFNAPREIRQKAIRILRNLVAKHEFDDRYLKIGRKERITSLYLPLISMILECRNRLAASTFPDEIGPLSVQNVGKLMKHSSRASLDTSSTYISKSPNPKLDQGVLSIISKVQTPSSQLNGSQTSLTSNDNDTVCGSDSNTIVSVSSGAKFESMETKDLLLSFLFVVRYAEQQVLLGWIRASSERDRLEFLYILELCLCHFRYKGQQRFNSLYQISDSSSVFNSKYNSTDSSSSVYQAISQAQRDASLFTEVCSIVLDVVCLILSKAANDINTLNLINAAIGLKVYLLRYGSERLRKHVFASLRSFTSKFSSFLYLGDANLCGKLCYEVLRCCTSPLESTRKEASALMYLLMRNNFYSTNRGNMKRVFLKTITAEASLISQMPNEMLDTGFKKCLQIIDSYAKSDSAVKNSSFPSEVKKLTTTLATVLENTTCLKEHKKDPEKYADLMYEIAMHYESTPELRYTWIENMAKFHAKVLNHSEAAQCHLHNAALVAEFLNRRVEFKDNKSKQWKQTEDIQKRLLILNFFSKNVRMEALKATDDCGSNEEIPYSEQNLTQLLEEAANEYERAGLYESVIDIYKLILPIYHERLDYRSLMAAHTRLANVCQSIIEYGEKIKIRPLIASYFKVSFYGKISGSTPERSSFVYKENGGTRLPAFIDRLKELYGDNAKDDFVILSEGGKIDESKLDKNKSYVQVTSVLPYFDDSEERTEFQKNNNINKFMYETPFTRSSDGSTGIRYQYKRRTIVTTSHHFPFVRKRIDIIRTQADEFGPIDIAIDEIEGKVRQLEQQIEGTPVNLKLLDLALSGALQTTVNAGPLAYAEAFFGTHEKEITLSPSKLDRLRELFIKFYKVCGKALETNKRLIDSENHLRQEQLVLGHKEMAAKLSQYFLDDSWITDDDNLNPRSSSRRTSNVLSFQLNESGSSIA